MKVKRYAVLDLIRGFSLLNMIVYHAVWDLVYLFGFEWQWYQSQKAYIWQQCICWTFIALSGFCQPLGKHRLKNGIYVFFAGWLLTIVTKLFMPQNIVLFGVLTLIGSCALLLLLVENILKRCPPSVGLVVSMFLFVITRNVNSGYLGFESFNIYKLPNGLYRNLITTYFGFPAQDFYSTDYFSLFPWLFLYLAGYFLYHLLNQRELLCYLERKSVTVIEWLGRHSLIIYLLHQPVLYFILSIIF